MKNNTGPLVSIVVPSYNQGHFIEDTIRSILNQSYGNIEVIVIDGGSKDGTLEVLRRYEYAVKFISEPDNGQSAAINKGFRMVAGDIVTWLNSDDIYPDRDAVRKIVSFFEGSGELDFVYGDFLEIDGNNRVLKIFRRPDFSYSRLLRIGYISQPATFFRRRVIENLPVREDLRFAMDLEYWLRACNSSYKFRHINYLIAAERLHEDAKCVKEHSGMESEARAVRESYGAKFDCAHRLLRFSDKLILYFLRASAVFRLISYRLSPERLSIPLSFDGSLRRTLFAVSVLPWGRN